MGELSAAHPAIPGQGLCGADPCPPIFQRLALHARDIRVMEGKFLSTREAEQAISAYFLLPGDSSTISIRARFPCLPAAALRMVRRASAIRPFLPITFPLSLGTTVTLRIKVCWPWVALTATSAG